MQTFRLRQQNLISRVLHVATAAAGVAFLSGCHTDMWTQPKIHKPFQATDFFSDGQSARLPVEHAVVYNSYHVADSLDTGISNGKLVTNTPFVMTPNDIETGRQLFNAFCSPCHGRLGYGDGMIARRGFNLRVKVGNYHTARLRRMPIGHFFDVISHGFGAMFSYAARVQDVRDRWRIAAYIRVLQLSQHAGQQDAAPGTDLTVLSQDPPDIETDQTHGWGPRH